jgi:hypothetical protein
MAENNEMSSNLKMETKSGIILFDSTWIAGVDYEANNNDESEEEE